MSQVSVPKGSFLMLGISASALLLALVGLPGMVSAHEGDASLIHSCLNPAGQIRIVGPNESCRPQETALDWSIAGPPGPPGPPGIPQPAAVTVNCDQGQSITQALQNIPGQPLTITVLGTCNENVTIFRDAARLVAGAPGATVNGPDTTRSTIFVTANRVVIDGLTVTGGRNGITGAGSGRLTIQNCVVQNTGRDGIVSFLGSDLSVDNCTVQNNPRFGINFPGGSGTVINSTITGNTESGILVTGGGNARIGINEFAQYAANTISNNGGSGVFVSIGGTAFIGGNTISGNGTNSAAIFGRSGVGIVEATGSIVGNNTITGNAGSGVFARSSSVLIGDPGFALPTANMITGNGASVPADAANGGVFGFLGTSLDIRDAIISGNTGNGVTLNLRSNARLLNDTVNNNMGHGILLLAGSGLFFNAPATPGTTTVMGNSGFGLECSGTEASFSGDTSGITGNTLGNVSPSCTGF